MLAAAGKEGILDTELAPELAVQAFPNFVSEITPCARNRIDEIILHSEPVLQILSVPPHYLTRWGATAIFGVVGFLVGLAWLIHFPDVVAASIVVTTRLPPAIVIAQTNGHLEHLSVRDADSVESGAVVARVHNSADSN